MVLLFDSGGLAPHDGDDALTDMFTQSGVPIRASHADPSADPHTEIHHWRYGSNERFLARGSSLRLTRSLREVRAAAPESIRVGYQLSGRYTLSAGDRQEGGGAGHLNVIDHTQTCEFTQYGAAAEVLSYSISYEDLGLPVDLVRSVAPIIWNSPVYHLLASHMAGLSRSSDRVAEGTSGALVGGATLDLVRALIVSSGPAESSRAEVLNDTLQTRIMAYTVAHLKEPGLGAEQIARAHHISVRQLYRLWAHEDLSLSQWIVSERLEGARRTLGSLANSDTLTQSVARDWGFVDPAHFSRRFRERYGLTPTECRALN
jgi:AraC-like DNA-binding protein